MTMQHLPEAGMWVDELDLDGYPDPAVHYAADVPPERLQLEGVKEPKGLHLDLDVFRTGAPASYEYHLRGRLSGDATLTCVRCLTDFPWHLEAGFEMRYLPISLKPLEQDSQLEHEILDAEVDMEYYRRPVFDLLGLVREQAYLELPMDPVCREDCQGLCPHCGADRNAGDHQCSETPIDPRWEALKRLRPTN